MDLSTPTIAAFKFYECSAATSTLIVIFTKSPTTLFFHQNTPVFVSHSARSTFTSAQITELYFYPCRDDFNEVILEYFRCRCGTIRKRTHCNGLTNFMQHVEMLDAATAEIELCTTVVENLYGWLVWLTMSLLPLKTSCKHRSTRRCSLCVSRPCAMEGVVVAVERSIASVMPDSFGVILNG
ncbi:hypothetical protein JG687_00014084 [Phytophthora cactorum]|uniref:Uncharacterized protein n=1 Tax=Phytophthora cactorum TaxID=29920 RepID=A0A8T1U1T4_9STRA|nr:hypothetical protein GQ600_18575 [Phytophthora cactorum]KAG6950707.1 hypothetical protein JG687_00014084 [Phytophthora cactorum]